jgi:hypothetical protein
MKGGEKRENKPNLMKSKRLKVDLHAMIRI